MPGENDPGPIPGPGPMGPPCIIPGGGGPLILPPRGPIMPILGLGPLPGDPMGPLVIIPIELFGPFDIGPSGPMGPPPCIPPGPLPLSGLANLCRKSNDGGPRGLVSLY